MTAFDKLRKFCLHYIKHNFDELQRTSNVEFQEKDVKLIKTDNDLLDWFLSEVAMNLFLEKSICLEASWDEDDKYFVCIYKVGSTYIKTIFQDYKTDVVYEFVKRKKKHVIVYEWVSK
jgi:hypothetical protein